MEEDSIYIFIFNHDCSTARAGPPNIFFGRIFLIKRHFFKRNICNFAFKYHAFVSKLEWDQIALIEFYVIQHSLLLILRPKAPENDASDRWQYLWKSDEY